MFEIASRWSGILLIAGAALLGLAIVIISLRPVMGVALPQGASLLLLLASIFLLLSLPAMYARQANAAGWLGITGYGLLQTGMVVLVLSAAPALLFPTLQPEPGENLVFFLLAIAFTLGLLLTGIATVRADIFPRGAGILLLAATAGFFFVFFIAEFLTPLAGQLGSAIFGILLALALAWIGMALWIGKLGPSM